MHSRIFQISTKPIPFLRSLQRECETLACADDDLYGEYPELVEEASNMCEEIRKVLE